MCKHFTRFYMVSYLLPPKGEVKLKIDVNFILQTLSCKLEFTKHVNCILQGVISFLHVPVNFQLFQCNVQNKEQERAYSGSESRMLGDYIEK